MSTCCVEFVICTSIVAPVGTESPSDKMADQDTPSPVPQISAGEGKEVKEEVRGEVEKTKVESVQ